MKIFRFGESGRERPGCLLREGAAVDVSPIVGDWSGDRLCPDFLKAFEIELGLHVNKLDLVDLKRSRFGPPVVPQQILSVGSNYACHTSQVGMSKQSEPIIAGKSIFSVCGPSDSIEIPQSASKIDWEVELAVVVGRRCYSVSTAEIAAQHIAGYCIANDLSDREWLLERGGEWIKGKSFPTFAPLGPFLATPSSFPHNAVAEMTCTVNGRVMQAATTAEMRFNSTELIQYISQFMVLAPGDVILTGSPAGSALGREDARFLRPGDVVSCVITDLGEQIQTCNLA